MTSNSSQRLLHRRRSVRLKGYDYSSPGAYFITICTHERRSLLGSVTPDGLRLNTMGLVVQRVWNDLPSHYEHIELDQLLVMPNHVHGVVLFRNDAGAGLKPAPTQNIRQPLSEIVRAFKTFSARGINILRHSPGVPVWQRNYYEHVIRDDEELNRIREYISTNPVRWHLDRENPDRTGADDLDDLLNRSTDVLHVGAGLKPAPTGEHG